MHPLDAGLPIGELVLRLAAALALGAVIGWDRERNDKPAGLRTHMLVTLGSATFCLMAFEFGTAMSEQDGGELGIDPTRVLQGVVGGIGFLGAGSIIQSRGQVRGITTAAGVWMAGALGAACGIGAYVLAVVSGVMTLTVLTLVAKLERLARARAGLTPGGPEAQDERRTRREFETKHSPGE